MVKTKIAKTAKKPVKKVVKKTTIKIEPIKLTPAAVTITNFDPDKDWHPTYNKAEAPLHEETHEQVFIIQMSKSDRTFLTTLSCTFLFMIVVIVIAIVLIVAKFLLHF